MRRRLSRRIRAEPAQPSQVHRHFLCRLIAVVRVLLAGLVAKDEDHFPGNVDAAVVVQVELRCDDSVAGKDNRSGCGSDRREPERDKVLTELEVRGGDAVGAVGLDLVAIVVPQFGIAKSERLGEAAGLSTTADADRLVLSLRVGGGDLETVFP